MSREALAKTDTPALSVRANHHAAGLDPRRARMVRDVADFGFDLRASVELGRLLIAMALGSLLTFALVGPGASTARVESRQASPMPLAATPAGDVAAGPVERGEPELRAPRVGPASALPDSPQRDVHSDGGGH